jgi:hypothetical protein
MSQLFTPYHLYDNLLLWLDGADPNANDGDGVPVQDKPIYKWVDKSQNKYIFEQNTEADAPTYDLANKRLAFDGTEHLSCTNIDNFPQQFNMYIVASITYTASTATNVVVSCDSADTESDWTFVQEKDSDEIEPKFTFQDTTDTTQTANSSVTVTNSAPAIFELLGDGLYSNSIQYVDVNNANNYGGAVSAKMKIDNDVVINLMKNIAGEETSGTIYEVLIFDALLDRHNRWAIQGYLKHKYNLSITETAAAGLTDVMQAGSDSIGTTALSVHPYRNNPPVTGVTKTINFTTNEEVTLSNIFQNAHKVSPRVPMQYVRLSLDFCDNVFGSNTFPSECTADSSAQPCFNTRETCQALNAYRLDNSGKRQYVFSQEMGDRLTGIERNAHSALISVSSAPTEIVPTKGISLRSNVTIKLRDFMSTDTDADDHAASRSYITTDQGSYFEKLLARNPHYVGRTVEVFDGYVGYDGSIQAQDGKKKYIIDSMFLDNDVLTIKCKDPMTLADELKAKVPVPSNASLVTDLAGSDTTLAITGVTDHSGVARVATSGHHNYSNNDIVYISETGLTNIDNKDFVITVNSTNDFDLTVSAGGTSSTGLSSKAVEIKIGEQTASASQIQSEFGTLGFLRINEEIIEFGRNSDTAAIAFIKRKEWGTTESPHDAGDAVQKCIAFGQYDGGGTAETINDVAFELLVNQAGIPAEACNNTTGGIYSWVDEKTNWLSTYRIDTIFSEPKQVNKQLSQLGSMVGVNFFYDDLTAQIVMRAETPEIDATGIVRVTDDHILEDSYRLIQADKDRVSRVYYYYNLRNSIDDRDKPKSFKNLYVNIDSDSETDFEYAKESNKVIYGWGIKDSSTATSVSQRLLNRFKKTPITCTFKLDASYDQLSTGDHFYLSTRHITDIYGAQKIQTEMQVLSTKFDSKSQHFLIKAKQFRFGTVNTGKITANDIGGFNAANADNSTVGFNSLNDTTGGLGTEENPYLGVRATGSFISNDANRAASSRTFITASVINGGENFQNTSTIAASEVTADQGTGLTLTATASGGVVQSVSVTSNPATGSNVGDASHLNYYDGQIVTCVDGVNNGGGAATGLQLRLNVSAKMSGGQEPYNIV